MGWRPPPSWRPDPAWGPAPPGWQFEVAVVDTRAWYAKKRVILPGVAAGLLVVGGLANAAASGGPPSASRAPSGASSSTSTSTPTADPQTAAAKAAADQAAADKAADQAAADQAAADKVAADKAAPLVSSDPASELRDYANCKELNGDYPHGVGRSGAVDKVSGGGAGVTNFTRNDELYALNSESDGDHDGIACEKR